MSFAKLTSMSHVAVYKAANFNTMSSPAYNAPPRTLQKSPTPPTSTAPITTQKPQNTAPITTQKETSPSTPETNVLPNATQSYPSPPAITTAPLDPWKLINQELENKINDIYKKNYWKPRFINSKQEQARFPIHRISETAAVVISRRNTKF